MAIFPFDGELIRSEELFFATRTHGFEPVFQGHTELEQRAITGHRWCSADEIRQLAKSGEPVYPLDLANLLVGSGDDRGRYRGSGSAFHPLIFRSFSARGQFKASNGKLDTESKAG